jgi:thiol-disulfide isomerase/thioredoxin
MKKALILFGALLLIVAIFGVTQNGQGVLNEEKEPSFDGATKWLNGQPLNLEELRGKVVVVDFWTYTCVNWRRTLPYVRAWALKYKSQGLVVIGVHTPEFSFEHTPKNVSNAINEMEIGYPVVMDNNYEIWNSFKNNYWPALYLIDAKGHIRYQKFGEGNYLESELKIQQLLKEASGKNITEIPENLHPTGFEAAADWQNLQSPENYVSYGRTKGFASVEAVIPDTKIRYSIPAQLKLNQWALSGEWIVGKENVTISKAPGKLIYRFHARDINLVMGLPISGTSVKFRVLMDGKPPGSAHGLNIDSSGNGVVTEQRMYQLIRQQGPIIDRDFQIEFFEPKVEVYDFTFG